MVYFTFKGLHKKTHYFKKKSGTAALEKAFLANGTKQAEQVVNFAK
jgi:hypothetical protein